MTRPYFWDNKSRNDGRRRLGFVSVAMVLILVVGTSSNGLLQAAHAAPTYAFTVQGRTVGDRDDMVTGMWVVIYAHGSIVKTGFTPLRIYGEAGTTYTAVASDYSAGGIYFERWGNWSTDPSRSVTLWKNTWFDAYYQTPSSGAPAPVATVQAPAPEPAIAKTSIQNLIPKTGAYVALYMYPSSSGDDHWQKVYDEKREHPSVPIVATFNPSSGPGWHRDSNIANWVDKLRSAGVIMIGYTHDDYGSRSLYDLNRDADKYKDWYNADGLFIDEMTNRQGYEDHYRDVTAYAKSIGMKMTMGNPGTDVPRSYIGTVDVINITEGQGYMPLSWLQLCIWCGDGWHEDEDKRNFAYIRYDIGWLDTSFVTESARWVGLMYITDGNDGNSRWFHVPGYFGTMMDVLDR